MQHPTRGPLARLLTVAVVVGLSLPVLAVPVPVRAQDVDQLETIMNETAAVRELPPLTNLDPNFLTSAEAQAEMEEMTLSELDLAEIDAAVQAAAAFGLMPADTDIVRLYLDLLGEQVGGYFDPETGRIVVVQDDNFGAMATYIFSHEVTHALQDQNLGLGNLIDGAEDYTSDQQLALMSLYEGDATLTAAYYLNSQPALALELGAEVGGGEVATEQLDQAPPIVALPLLFPYATGPFFVRALQEGGGWAAVDAAYSTLPVSTEQIMHPEKYVVGELPVAVTVPDAAATLGDGWTQIDDDTMGEFQIAVLLANLAPGEGMNQMTGEIEFPGPAATAAAGWAGDQYGFWVNGDQQALVWDTVWDTEQDASQFIAALRRYDGTRFGTDFTVTGERTLTLELDGQVIQIVQTGSRVSYVQAPNLDATATVIAALLTTPAATPAATPVS